MWPLALALLVAVALPTGFARQASAAPPIGVIGDPGFEEQTHRTISAPWSGEGPDYKGIDMWRGYQKTGDMNGSRSSCGWMYG
ncbi:hypothetical protein AQI88_26490 [Streptomyces cellostaticus]|uniref:Uncharacterized protein n=1 Tax=Streptomyces cellostaticus TaxID=67285 RepID=A0A117PV93_9ACTN|nr:hypothetical protein [Streptomyces cellostaticus]KUM93333.1 hypothetical protein AQI88_26490 [Streptomyces cellostaticus]GHI02331.1 hypothetical protein Scel_06520 [Streptomyces cellostaticus]